MFHGQRGIRDDLPLSQGASISLLASLVYLLFASFSSATFDRGEVASLVADTDEVVCELLDGVGGYAGLDVLGVVGDEDGHVGLDDHDAFLAL